MTHKVLLAGCLLLFGVGSLLFAIDKSAKVGPLAGIALIEGATMVGIFLFFAKIEIIFVAQSFIVQDTLGLSIDISISFNAFLHANQGTKLISDRPRETFELDLLVTAWAGHETKGDAKGRPLMLKEIH